MSINHRSAIGATTSRFPIYVFSFVASARKTLISASLTAIARYAKNQMVDVESKVVNVIGRSLAIWVEIWWLIFSVSVVAFLDLSTASGGSI